MIAPFAPFARGVARVPMGVGADASGAFSAQILGTLKAVAGDTTVKAELSGGARVSLDLSLASLDAIAKKGAKGVTDELAGLGMQLASTALHEALAALGVGVNVVPLLGQLVSMGIFIAQALTTNAARGTGRSVEEQVQYCSRSIADGGWIEPVVQTAAAGPVPADYFINDRLGTWKDGSPKYRYTSLGRSLIAATESVGEADAKSYYGLIGLPAERRALYRKLRKAICACRVNTPPGQPHPEPSTDGGVMLWTLYVDMLRADMARGIGFINLAEYLMILDFGAMPDGKATEDQPFQDDSDFKHMNRDVARLIYKERSWGNGRGLDAAREYAGTLIEEHGWFSPCELWTGAGQRAIRGFVDNWNLTLDPFYVQFDDLEAAASRALAELLAAEGVNKAIDLRHIRLKFAKQSGGAGLALLALAGAAAVALIAGRSS